MNDMILFISKSNFCSDSSDRSMFLNMTLYNKVDNKDAVAIDGGYTIIYKSIYTLWEKTRYWQF